ncbi:MAG: methyl-accepting chemotaxis protein [Pseudomonadota bacterium]
MATTTSRPGDKRVVSTRAVWLLGLLLPISMAMALWMFFHIQTTADHAAYYLQRAGEQQLLPSHMARLAAQAVRGDPEAFAQLKILRKDFENFSAAYRVGSPKDGVPPSPRETLANLDQLDKTWDDMSQSLNRVIGSRGLAVELGERKKMVEALVTNITEDTDGLVKLLVKSKQPQPPQIQAAMQLGIMAEQFDVRASKSIQEGRASIKILDDLQSIGERYERLIAALRSGDNQLLIKKLEDNEARQQVDSIESQYAMLRGLTGYVLSLLPKLTPVLDAVTLAETQGDRIVDVLRRLTEQYRQVPGRFSLGGITVGLGPAIVAAIATLVFLLLTAIQLVTDARAREANSRAINEANQRAILRLLDEMGNLADGDLTVNATVTEDITGAIADSVNYAVDALRSLVTTINQTAVRVTGSVQESRAIALHLQEATEIQTEQIGRGSQAIRGMTLVIDQMSKDANESAEVASRAVETAAHGGETVRKTIRGMDTIRDQIQETSKRIKRLGESSQEIGEIVELIDDIADQTNILALNAAMQAAMAGEAGRGFAVVADEVQRLAERAGNATKQIEGLVKTIQADTHEAVSSMEASTGGVVTVARQAEEAGESLLEIENVSNYIADLTRKIADSAQKQSRQAAGVDDTMNVIQEITTQTADGTSQTAASIGELAELAEKLQQSVSGFRLPD